MSETRRRVLVTSALPYANGDIHIGHLVEYIMTDIHVRFLRMRGVDVAYMCASDSHGSPIEMKALSLGMDPEAMVAMYRERHMADFAAFQIRFDRYYTTHSEETKKHAYAIFEGAKERGLIYTKEVEGLYSEVDRRFLPDRWIRGTCPRCKAPDQYGDSCESCGATYRPTDLIDPRSAISGDAPVVKKTTHYFYKLSACADFLRGWVNSAGAMPEATRQFVNEWLDGGLRDWDISREAPYFGFLIPGETDKYFYVWLDAPVGYIGTTDKWCQETGCDVADFWRTGSRGEIVHVIGKDIVYFHCLFWPAMLENAGYKLPDRVQVHGFLTVGGEKMSKSRGTFINAATYLKHLDPQYLRYYYACKQRSEPDDLDLHVGTWTDPSDPETLDASKAELVEKVNAELVNKLANLASRVIPFVEKRLGGRLGKLPPEAAAIDARIQNEIKPAVAIAYESFDTQTALRIIGELADEGNKYFQEAAPWAAIKGDPEQARAICTLGANYVKVLTGMVAPIVPVYAEKIEKALAIPSLTWDAIRFDLADHAVGVFEAPVIRVDPEKVRAMVLESRATLGTPTETARPTIEPIKAQIAYDDFAKVDLRVAVIAAAEGVSGADKLLKLTIDLGEAKPRTIFAGIKKHYDPAKLVGRRIVVVANLAPRKMKFGTSEGMLLAAADGDDVLLLGVDGEPAAGSTIS
jgi:methionyl-tRNA synthetase